MDVLHMQVVPVLQKKTMFLKGASSLKPCCTLKHGLFVRATHISSKEDVPRSCENQLTEPPVCEQSNGKGSVSIQSEAALELDGSSATEKLWKKHVEEERRRKISLANKGKVPWNKGRAHNAETRELISKRTTEALNDPKVKEKLRGFRHFHSDQSKAKLSISLRKRWKKRLKEKKVKEKCYMLWVSSIADAAKVGSYDQDELEWNSYEIFKVKIASEFLQWKEEKIRNIEIKKLNLLKVAERREARMAKREQERREKEERARIISMKSSKRLEGELNVSLNRLKEKAKLSKLMVPLPVGKSVICNKSDVKKWDLEFVEKERLRREISLADQIQAAKNKKMGEPKQAEL